MCVCVAVVLKNIFMYDKNQWSFCTNGTGPTSVCFFKLLTKL